MRLGCVRRGGVASSGPAFLLQSVELDGIFSLHRQSLRRNPASRIRLGLSGIAVRLVPPGGEGAESHAALIAARRPRTPLRRARWALQRRVCASRVRVLRAALGAIAPGGEPETNIASQFGEAPASQPPLVLRGTAWRSSQRAMSCVCLARETICVSTSNESSPPASVSPDPIRERDVKMG